MYTQTHTQSEYTNNLETHLYWPLNYNLIEGSLVPSVCHYDHSANKQCIWHKYILKRKQINELVNGHSKASTNHLRCLESNGLCHA